MAYNYYPNNQFYMQDLQNMKDKIDNQMRQLQNQQPIQQPQIHQNFQLAPQNNNNELESKYADNFDEVKNTFVMKTGIFTKRDFSTIWIKDVSGNIRTFKTEEVVELDEKDREILDLQRQLNELRGEIENAKSVNTDAIRTVENKKPARTSSNSKSNAK